MTSSVWRIGAVYRGIEGHLSGDWGTGLRIIRASPFVSVRAFHLLCRICSFDFFIDVCLSIRFRLVFFSDASDYLNGSLTDLFFSDIGSFEEGLGGNLTPQ